MSGDLVTPLFLLVVGLLLVVIEVTIIPGFGVAGVAGVVLIAAGTVVTWSTYGAALGATVLVASAVLTVVLIVLFLRSKASRRLIREERITGDSSDVPKLTHLVGRTGVVTKPLRPSGIAEIDGRPYDVVCEGQYLDRGQKVVVRRIMTNSIVVERINEGGA